MNITNETASREARCGEAIRILNSQKEVLDKVKGLSDLLWAAAVQSEIGVGLRTEGITALANIASDIEHELESLTTDRISGSGRDVRGAESAAQTSPSG